MKQIFSVQIILIVMLLISSCSEGTGAQLPGKCNSDKDCKAGFKCDPVSKQCVLEEGKDDGGVLPVNDEDEIKDDQDKDVPDKEVPDENEQDDDIPIGQDCVPGDEEECPYEGPSGTKDVGECKSGKRVCKENGTWGFCSGEVLPKYETGEMCNDGKDHACVGTPDTGWDEDGDGVPSCLDCCEYAKDCPDPVSAWDENKHFCSFDESSHDHLYECGDDLPEATKNPFHYAKAIGLCPKVTKESGEWGVISAQILLPNGQVGAHNDAHNLLSGLGPSIKPLLGPKMLALSSGEAVDPFPNEYTQFLIKSEAPADWLAANGGEIPNSPGCPAPAPGVNDPVMLQMEIRVPMGVKSFSFNIFFLSTEFPFWVCKEYNDFFISLLDSEHTSDDPEFQNPSDKNLAMAPGGYPVGVNMAMMEDSELFTVCEVSADWPSCQGAEDLVGTGGFETFPHMGTPAKRGGTGWLTVRGNVVEGEVIKLRLAIWDTGDHIFDSLVLIDNFRWQFEEYKPGVEK